MTIRWKLNSSIIALIAIFLAAAAFSMHAVTEMAEQTRVTIRMRELSQLTADIRAVVYAQLAGAHDPTQLPEDDRRPDWARTASEDVDVQIRLAHNDRERQLWIRLRQGVENLNRALHSDGGSDDVHAILNALERTLRELRNYYDIAQYDATAIAANTSLVGQMAIGAAGLLTVLLFLAHLVMIRKWLMRPIEVLKSSAEVIGRGELKHRVPLDGHDELCQLARHVDAMAEGLERHQTALIEARELSAIGELCANVAHGLRNPLSAIRTTVQLAERRAQASKESVPVLLELAEQTDRMDRRITRLFAFSRPLRLQPVPTPFRMLAEGARAQIQSLLTSHSVELLIDDGTEGRLWSVDREQVADALAELLANAIHHSPDGARVILRGQTVAPPNGLHQRLRIDVIDHGAGMSEATREKAFDLFFTSRPAGTGLGLGLVRRVIDKHGGEISIASSLGRGTTVTIVLSGAEAR